ncbi:MAG: tRNA (guanosine(46)-N7)-methyltransferase TrmB [Tannerellaceae bacterium]|jgi:tRNA (guanine-N7-)-methyltransferase|nr:tRNA (guanosine(46)-N7)-methyltransferase TrmB [Tannerellaceae bacterium]
MGKNKLIKFSEMEGYPHVFQYPYDKLRDGGFELKGAWSETFFENHNPIVLELGCGKGEYTVGLARAFPEKNFIGIDIKGARMWTGARESFKAGMTNVAFLRTNIELITSFFAPGEISEIWLTFPDPQMKKSSKRLSSARFMELYRQILVPRGLIHLKTDSRFLYSYTLEMAKANRLNVLSQTEDLYRSTQADGLLSIRTFYEQQWIDRGLSIKYLSFVCEERRQYVEPQVDIEWDIYRSYGRGKRNAPPPHFSNISLPNANDL